MQEPAHPPQEAADPAPLSDDESLEDGADDMSDRDWEEELPPAVVPLPPGAPASANLRMLEVAAPETRLLTVARDGRVFIFSE